MSENLNEDEIVDRNAGIKVALGEKFQPLAAPTYNFLPKKDRLHCKTADRENRYAIRLNGAWVRIRFENEIKEEERQKQRKLERGKR